MRGEIRPHAALAELAERQYGVVSFSQLRELGYSKGAIGRATEARRLHRMHQGVYSVGHRRIPERGRCFGAVLACGPRAVLSHAAAAWLWGTRPALAEVIDVTVRGGGGGKHVGIAVHRSSTLDPVEYGRLADIRVTALPRTLLDVAADRPIRELNGAIERAERLGVLDLGQIDALLRRRRGDRGAARLREATEIYRDPISSRARSERLFLAMVKAAGLPRPAINTWVDKFEIDAYWEAERFAVEVDGWEAHRTRRAFEDDHLRWEEMKLAGIEVVPISTRSVEQRPRELGSRLKVLLKRRRAQLRRND